MIRTEQIQSLDRIHCLERRCFLRYLVDEAEIKVFDEYDGTIEGSLRTWTRDSRAGVESLERLLMGENHIPAQGSWPLTYSQYNFLRATYLQGPLTRRMQDHLQALENEAGGVSGWRAAEKAVADLIGTHRSWLEKLSALAPEKAPESTPVSERKRERSANWW